VPRGLLSHAVCFGEFGGTPEASAEKYDGCFRDKSDPSESRPISINGEIYFAGQSRPWGNGGVAFIRENSEQGSTLGRMYLITEERERPDVPQDSRKRSLTLLIGRTCKTRSKSAPLLTT
jgi:hypothetical protein